MAQFHLGDSRDASEREDRKQRSCCMLEERAYGLYLDVRGSPPRLFENLEIGIIPITHPPHIAALRDPAKRPQTRQVPLPDWLFDFDLNAVLPLSTSKLYGNLSGARLRVLLDDEVCTELLGSATQQPAGALLPSAVLEGCRQNMSA